MERFMCAELEMAPDGCMKLGPKVVCDLCHPNMLPAEVPDDWRTAARLGASYAGLDLKESDLVDVKSYIDFKIRTSPFFKNHSILSDVDLTENLPDGNVVISSLSGLPLMVFWEEDF